MTSPALRIGIQAWGSEGDVRPLVALAARLRREGHSPSLVLSPVDGRDYAPLCRAMPVPLQVVPERMEFSLESLKAATRSADMSAVSRAVLDLAFFPYLEQMYEAALSLCAKSDVVLGGSSSFFTKAAAIKTGTPFVAVDFYPGMVPSRTTPPPGMADWKWFNGLRWRLLHVVLDLAFKKGPAKFFAEKGLPPIRHANPDAIFSEQLNLHAASPAFCPPAPDWSPVHQVCGEFFVADEQEENWVPSPELADFLRAGERPVLVSLGSMEPIAPERAVALIGAAVRKAHVRAIVQSKRAVAEERRDGEVYYLRWAPHRRLLPLCAAMVHHGGAGTTHAALRAGVPAVVVPFIFEQRLWGKQLQRVGAAPAPLSFWKATPEALAARIREAVDSERLRAGAAALASAMAPEDGTGTAMRLLERLVAGKEPEVPAVHGQLIASPS